MFRRIRRSLCLLLFIPAAMARADLISYSDSIDLQKTNWHGTLVLPQFHPAWGTLNGLTISLTGHLWNNVHVENLSRESRTVKGFVQTQIVLQRPDFSTLGMVRPMTETLDTLGAFDGVVDYAGASGATHVGLSSSEFTDMAMRAPGDLDLFTGMGSIMLPAYAKALLDLGEKNSLRLTIDALAGLNVTITYDYTPQAVVPEPAAVTLGGLGLALGLVLLRRQ